MILRLSAKLKKKFHVDFDQSLPPSGNPLLDWSADLFTADRTQHILVTNTVSLYSIVMYGKGVTDETRFFRDTIAAMRGIMSADGYLSIFEDAIAPAFYPAALAKGENRRVIGSMNELIYQARTRLVEQDLSPYDTSFFLNGVLMSYIDYRTPREVFASMAGVDPGS
jgi:hypothetical protein